MSTTAERRTGSPAPPLPLVVLSWAVLLFTVGLAIAGAWKTGIAWDETYHVQRMNNYLDTGWFAINGDFAGDGPSTPGRTTYVYGPVTMILLHCWSVLFGVDDGGSVSASLDAYGVRHLGVVLIGLIGLAASAGITRLLLGSWRWAVVTAAILGALPLWTGNIMVNIKDVPVATGCTLVTLALVWSARAGSDRLGPRAARVACLAAGCTLAIGTRPGIWTAIAAGVGTYAVLVLLNRRVAAEDARPALAGFVETAAGLALSAVLLVLAYPKVFSTPLRALKRSAESSSQFPHGDSTRSYLPEQVLLGIPLLLVLVWVIGTAIGLLWVLGTRREPVRATRIGIVGVQAFTLPLIAIALDSDLYNGLRQVLFVAPACAVLATVGLCWSLERVQVRPHLVRGAVAAFALLGLVGPTVDQAILFPFGYTYANATADLLGTDTESDYWRTSVRELSGSIPNDGQVVCSPRILADHQAFRRSQDDSLDCRESPIGPLAPLWRDRELPLSYSIPDPDFYVVTLSGRPVPPNCTSIDRVTRWRHGRTIELSQVARCHLRAGGLAPRGIRFDGSPLSWIYAVRGWDPAVTAPGLISHGVAAAVSFRTFGECATVTCTLALQATVPDDLAITAGGQPLSWSRLNDRQVLVELDPGVMAAAGDDGVWITFSRSAESELSMDLRGLRVLLPE